ncbi:hypothetical protein CR513_61782, partial [Mucuna pruriens]
MFQNKFNWLCRCSRFMVVCETNYNRHIITLFNYEKILALHEASCKYVWLRSIIQHVKETYGLSLGKMSSTIIYENNVTCIT